MRTKIPFRLTLIALCLGGVLDAPPARADSATGHDTVAGNALNPAGVNPLTAGQPEARAGLMEDAERTPTGLLFDLPREPTPRIRSFDSGWQAFGHVEFGLLSIDGDRRAYGFRRYKDLDNGLYLTNFGLSAVAPKSAHFFEVTGGALTRDDQFVALVAGRYNDYRVRAFYNETPHVFTTTFRSIYDGIGSGNLTLKSGLTPGGSGSLAQDNLDVAAVANANAGTELSLKRKKGGLSLDKHWGEQWSLYVYGTSENRKGARPFASVWLAGGGTAPTETVEPIDYDTHELGARVSFRDAGQALNVLVSASLFRNAIDTLRFEVPYRVNAAVTNGIAPGGFTAGRFDLYPDNDYYQVRADYGLELPQLWNGRLTAVAAWSTSRQNDRLIPYTAIPGVTLTNVVGSNWNTTDALSRQSADARIDADSIDLGLTLRPLPQLGARLSFKRFETRNKTEFLACNPNASYADADPYTAGAQPGVLSAYGCSGVWGRLINDGSGSSVVLGNTAAPGANALANGAAGNQVIRNIPFDHRRTHYGLAADWRLAAARTMEFGYEREEYRRAHRERDRTWEDKYRVAYVDRGLDSGTLRIAYEHGDRRGDTYVTDAYHAFVSQTLLPLPANPPYNGGVTTAPNLATWTIHMNSRLRKHDLADRRQDVLNARYTHMVGEAMDVSVGAQYRDVQYPSSEYGRTGKMRSGSYNADLNYQPSERWGLFGFYSYADGKERFRGVPNVGAACIVGAVGGPPTLQDAILGCADPNRGYVFNVANAYSIDSKDRNQFVGVGARYAVGAVRTELSYGHAEGRTRIRYAVPANLAAASAALAGDGLPDIKTTEQIVEGQVAWSVSPRIGWRLLVRHERGRYTDWHYAGLESSPVVGNPAALPVVTVLDAGPKDYRATTFGVFVLLRL